MLGSMRQTLIFTLIPLLPSFGTLGKCFQSSILNWNMRTTLHTSKGCFKETQRKVPSIHRGSKNVGYCFSFTEQTFIEYAGHLLGTTEMKKSRFLPWKTPKSISQPLLPATYIFRYPHLSSRWSPKVMSSQAQDSSAGKLVPAALPRAPDPRPGQQLE